MREVVSGLIAAACLTGGAWAHDVSAPGPAGRLHGEMRKASPDTALALIIPGSGAIDRDGNGLGGLNTNLYKMLADELATLDVTTIRIDKRGMFSSGDAVVNANDVTLAKYAADVRSWITAHKGARECIWLIGHSEGALVALFTVAQNARDICGVVAMAGPGRPFGHILREQLARIPTLAPHQDAIDRILTAFETGQPLDANQPIPDLLQGVFAPEVEGYLRDLARHDPAQLAAATSLPLQILRGDQDLQVMAADSEALFLARPDADRSLFYGLNHIFKSVPAGDVGQNYASYGQGDLPLGTGVAVTVADFILTQ